MFALQPQAKFKGAISLAWSGGWAFGAASAQARGSGYALGEVLALTRLSGSTCPSCLRPGRCPLLVARRGEPLPARRSLFWVSAARRGASMAETEETEHGREGTNAREKFEGFSFVPISSAGS
jgi:hypothetical protein